MSHMEPRANLGGICRQPIRPGEWQGFKAASKNTTYIQNNFYGSSIFGANRNMGYRCYDGNYQNHEVPGWMKWVSGIGLGAQLLGGIFKLFQKDKPSEAGGEEPAAPATPTNPPIEAPTDAPVEQPTTPPAEEVTEPPSTPPSENGSGNGAGVQSKANKNNKSVNTKFGWYETGKDSHAGRFQNCKNVRDIASALANTKTKNDSTAANSPNQNFINSNLAAIQKAIVAANPGMFDASGNIKAGVDVNKIKIPDMQWIADTYGNGTKAPSGNGRTVKRNAQSGKTETYSKDGQKLKDSYVNARIYNVTKGGNKYQVKVSPDGKEKWYYDQNGKAISEKEFQSLTGLTGNQVIQKAKASKAK